MPKISIIIPVFNGEKYFYETIQNLLKQSLKDMEFIIINDGSTDSTQEICDRVSCMDARIRVLSQKNMGVSMARNAGLDIAQGEYIGFFDADDIADDDYYESMYKDAKEKNADIVAYVRDSIRVDTYEVLHNGYASDLVCELTNIEAIRNILEGKLFDEGVVTKLFSREICQKVSFIEGKNINEDKFYNYQAFGFANKVFFRGIPKYHQISRLGSVSKSGFSAKQLDYIYFANVIEKDVRKKYPSLQCIAQANKLRTYLLVILLMAKGKALKDNSYKEYSDKILAYIRKSKLKNSLKHLNKRDKIKFIMIRISPRLLNLYLLRDHTVKRE